MKQIQGKNKKTSKESQFIFWYVPMFNCRRVRTFLHAIFSIHRSINSSIDLLVLPEIRQNIANFQKRRRIFRQWPTSIVEYNESLIFQAEAHKALSSERKGAIYCTMGLLTAWGTLSVALFSGAVCVPYSEIGSGTITYGKIDTAPLFVRECWLHTLYIMVHFQLQIANH